MKRVLIVDDARELGRLLQTVFLTLDPTLTINVVPSAEEALLMSTRMPLDLLVSDIRLPGMSGFELVRKIRARHPAIKVLMITGMTETSIDEHVRELQVDGFFRKPLDMGSFLDATRRCLDISANVPLTPLGGVAASYAVETLKVKTGPLTPSPAEPEIKEGPHATLSEIVVSLRQRVGAAAIFILDERGRIIAQAGEVPDLPLESEWVGPVMAAISAGGKVARLVGDGLPAQVMAFAGKEYHVVLAPAGDFALLILVHPGHSTLRMAVAVEEALEVQQTLRVMLPGAEPKLSIAPEAEPSGDLRPPSTGPLPELESLAPVSEPEILIDSQALAEFEALLTQSEDELKDKDVDAYWEKLAAKGQPGLAANPDALSYDQALKLGLAPGEDQ